MYEPIDAFYQSVRDILKAMLFAEDTVGADSITLRPFAAGCRNAPGDTLGLEIARSFPARHGGTHSAIFSLTALASTSYTEASRVTCYARLTRMSNAEPNGRTWFAIGGFYNFALNTWTAPIRETGTLSTGKKGKLPSYERELTLGNAITHATQYIFRPTDVWYNYFAEWSHR